MPTGQVKTFFSHDPDSSYRTVRLVLDNLEVLCYIEFADGTAGVETTGTEKSSFWFHEKGVPPGLIMEFFLMCFEAPIPSVQGWKKGKVYEW